jgi:hypothetical protein
VRGDTRKSWPLHNDPPLRRLGRTPPGVFGLQCDLNVGQRASGPRGGGVSGGRARPSGVGSWPASYRPRFDIGGNAAGDATRAGRSWKVLTAVSASGSCAERTQQQPSFRFASWPGQTQPPSGQALACEQQHSGAAANGRPTPRTSPLASHTKVTQATMCRGPEERSRPALMRIFFAFGSGASTPTEVGRPIPKGGYCRPPSPTSQFTYPSDFSFSSRALLTSSQPSSP